MAVAPGKTLSNMLIPSLWSKELLKLYDRNTQLYATMNRWGSNIFEDETRRRYIAPSEQQFGLFN